MTLFQVVSHLTCSGDRLPPRSNPGVCLQPMMWFPSLVTDSLWLFCSDFSFIARLCLPAAPVALSFLRSLVIKLPSVSPTHVVIAPMARKVAFVTWMCLWDETGSDNHAWKTNILSEERQFSSEELGIFTVCSLAENHKTTKPNEESFNF